MLAKKRRKRKRAFGRLVHVGDTYEAVQLVKHGYAVDVGSVLNGYTRLESVGFGVRDCNCTSSFCTQRMLIGS